MARRHYTIVTKKVPKGRQIELAVEQPSRGEAEKASLGFVRLHGTGNVAAVTVERELTVGEVLRAG